MRLLCAIPHHYRRADKPVHGSQRHDPAPRLKALRATLLALHQLFGPRSCFIDIRSRSALPLDRVAPCSLDIAICTTGDHHLLGSLDLGPGWYRHVPTRAEPQLLGYECHAVLRDGLADHDAFAYLEDDLVVHDPCFLDKVFWFTALAGSDCLLQPNRYEVGSVGPFRKAYVDGDLAPRVTRPFQDLADRPIIAGRFLGQPVRFARPLNPHSGCFFLTREQLARWAGMDHFLDRSTSFIGPLESAATLGVMRAFRIYKPVPGNASFLEVEHQGTGFIGLIGKTVAIGPGFE